MHFPLVSRNGTITCLGFFVDQAAGDSSGWITTGFTLGLIKYEPIQAARPTANKTPTQIKIPPNIPCPTDRARPRPIVEKSAGRIEGMRGAMNMVQAAFKAGIASTPKTRVIAPEKKIGIPHQRIQLFKERTANKVTRRRSTSGRSRLRRVICLMVRSVDKGSAPKG